MPSPGASSIARFGPFTLDLKSGELNKHGKKIGLQEQSFRILTVMVEHPGELVTRDELRERLWPNDTIVEFGHSINSAIKRLRDVLGDTADKPKYVETVARKGYRFLVPVDWEPVKPGNSMAFITKPEVGSDAATTASSVEMLIPQSKRAPQVPKRRFTQGLTLFIVGALVGGLVLFSEVRHFPWFGRPNGDHITSLAVLPLENLSGDKGQNYFVDGMTDELISALGKISALRVISRTSVVRYRGAQKPVQEIARDLHVDAVIEGTVLRSGDRVRITAHLIKALPEAHVWTETYEREMGDVTMLQDDVAQQIANEIHVKLTPEEHTRLANAQPVSPRAHEAYLKGRYLFNKWTDEGVEKSVGALREAINLDSRYALAYAGLADSYLVLGGHGLMRPSEAYPNAEKAAKKALEIDETLGEAHAALGFALSCYDRDWKAAERELRRAIKLNPNYATAHFFYADHLQNIGQAENAIAECQRGRDLDPMSLVANAVLGRMLRDGRRFDEAIQQCRKTIELEPNFAHGHWCLGLAYLSKARHHDAIQEFQKARALGEGPGVLWSLGYAYATAGRKSEAREILSDLRKQSRDGYVSPYFMAGIYAGLGEKDHAFEWLNRAYEEREWMQLKLDPFLDSLRSDPRFHQLLSRMNLPF
jgi:TolB-like protein/DNA-binding winged helix-turn-helix (wHTH) protein/Flp pilus assembly protein TadD